MWRVASSPIFFQVFPPSSDLYTPSPQEELWRLFGSPVPTHTTDGSDGAIAMSSMRPPMVAGPSSRNSRFLNLSEGFGWSPGGACALTPNAPSEAAQTRIVRKAFPVGFISIPPARNARHVTPAGPHNASSVLKGHTNPVQSQTRR